MVVLSMGVQKTLPKVASNGKYYFKPLRIVKKQNIRSLRCSSLAVGIQVAMSGPGVFQYNECDKVNVNSKIFESKTFL